MRVRSCSLGFRCPRAARGAGDQERPAPLHATAPIAPRRFLRATRQRRAHHHSQPGPGMSYITPAAMAAAVSYGDVGVTRSVKILYYHDIVMSLDVTLGYPKMVCSQVFRVYIHVMIRRLVRNARKSSNPILRNLSCYYTTTYPRLSTSSLLLMPHSQSSSLSNTVA